MHDDFKSKLSEQFTARALHKRRYPEIGKWIKDIHAEYDFDTAFYINLLLFWHTKKTNKNSRTKTK